MDYKIQSVKVASYQSVSGAGKEAQQELLEQSQNPDKTFKPVNFSHPIAFNSIPQIGGIMDDGFCTEEDKIMMETRKILNLPDLNISAFTVRVPSLNGHAEVLWVELDQIVTKKQILKSLGQIENMVVSEDGFHVVREVSGQKEVFVGRLHQDRFNSNTWIMWVVADNLLKGAAWNALQIAELLFKPKS
jgi:aspartate-semialdehyde dehydrogenase